MLRKHQKEMSCILDEIIAGRTVKEIIISATPGAGKSSLPLLAGRLITASLADKICWVVPRLTLQGQAESNFVDPFFRRMFNHSLLIRSSTNDMNPSRGLAGFATTYQALGLDNSEALADFRRQRYILILDENHHVEDGSLWHKQISPLYEAAKYRILMSGTMGRGNQTKIAFIPYGLNGGGLSPDLQETEQRAVIRYSRADALRERAIIPLSFHLRDSKTLWETRRGKRVELSGFDKAKSEEDVSRALFTALNTEFSEDLLKEGVAHWLNWRSVYPTSKLIIVTSSIEQAKRHTGNLEKMGFRGLRYEIATSDESKEAHQAIKLLKSGKLDLLVTCQMCYEGLDCPSISHIIGLTRIRTAEWIEQMTARANRIDPMAGPYDTQMGHIFAPADPLFRDIVTRIEREQLPFITQAGEEKREKQVTGDGDTSWFTLSPGGIVPISSAMTGQQRIEFPRALEIETPSEKENRLRDQIETHVRLYSFKNRFKVQEINRRIMAHFDYQPREEMDLGTLEKVMEYVLEKFPIDRVRGTGNPRVPTKAEPLKVEWR